jgi:Beta-lactamase enzyme family
VRDHARVLAALPTPPPVVPPALVVPGAHEISFGRLVGTVGPGTRRILVTVDGRLLAERVVRGHRFDFAVALPRRDVTLTVSAVDDRGRRASTVVGPVYGLPRTAAPRAPPLAGYEDARLARTIRALAHTFAGTCSVFVQDLRDGAGAAWNAQARLPAASTLKVAIAVEVLRVLHRKPALGTRSDRLLRQMLVYSDSRAANELLVLLGGSTSGGSARVNASMRALGLMDTDMYGGYEVPRSTAGRNRKPIPLRVESQPSFVGKYTTAWDYGRLLRYVHLATEGKGMLVRRFRGSLIPAEARYLLFVLAHTAEPNRLDRYLHGGGVAVLQKAGWIAQARHDGGLVYWPGGAFVAVVMTWSGQGTGTASDILAGRVARAALERFRLRG